MSDNRKYDYIMPLGLNCESGNMLREFYGKIRCSYLQWVAMHGNTPIEYVLTNPDLVFSGTVKEYRAVNMWGCDVTHMIFHGKARHRELRRKNGEPDLELIVAQKQETISRVKHMVRKFNKISRSSKFYKPESAGDIEGQTGCGAG